MIGLVGPSGAGKSTLMNLVCRFYDVAEGAILVDGARHPLVSGSATIAATSASCCRSRSCSTARSPRTSPTAGPTPSRAEIIAAAKAADAHEFILRLPDGYDSLVGERGQSLSGGERQRISIARALLIDPRILILDEATSSVDTETEREIQEALDNLDPGPHHDRHRPPPEHAPQRRPAGRARARPDRGSSARTPNCSKSPGPYARLHKAQTELAVGKLDVEVALTPSGA